jgi:hypothetical protein
VIAANRCGCFPRCCCCPRTWRRHVPHLFGAIIFTCVDRVYLVKRNGSQLKSSSYSWNRLKTHETS